MSIVFCCFYEAYPPATGAAAVSYNLAKFMSKRRLLIQFGCKNSQREMVNQLRVVTLAGTSENRIARLRSLPKRVKRIADEVGLAKGDVVILEGASWALFHLLLLARLRHCIPEAKIIYHAHNVEYLLRLQRHGRAVAALTRCAEGQLARQVDLSTAVSMVDQGHFERLYGVRPILLPNGVDIDRFAAVPPERVGCIQSAFGLDRRSLLFSGFYAYPPNRAAVDFLVSSVMPRIRAHYPSAKLVLTGGGVPYHEPWITNLGSVPYEELAPFVKACGIAVAPIFSGSGTRLKILDAMAAGLPVVATEKATEGLGLRPDDHFLLAHDRHEFASAIVSLFENPRLASELSISAKKRIMADFSWQTIARHFQQAIDQLMPKDMCKERLA